MLRTFLGLVFFAFTCGPLAAQATVNGVPAPVTGPISITPAVCLAAVSISTPCVAYQGAFTGLGASSGTGTITLYTSNAPSGARFQFCPNISVTTVGTAGNANMNVSWTTPGGIAESRSLVFPGLTSTSSAGNCASVALAANSSLTFSVSVGSSTGTPVWETEPVVLRLF